MEAGTVPGSKGRLGYNRDSRGTHSLASAHRMGLELDNKPGEQPGKPRIRV